MTFIAAIERRLSELTGFKRYAAAFGLGALMTLALPPVGAFFILLVSVPGLIWMTRACRTKKSSFGAGWAFGAGYFIFGLYWISVALFVDIASFWWALPLSAIVGPAVFALYYGFIPLLAWRYRKHKVAYALMTVTAWALIEWVRGHALTGFPWNLPGYTWHLLPPVMQTSAALGIYGLTLLTLLWAALPALRTDRKISLPLIALFAVVVISGAARLSFHPVTPYDEHRVRIVQPNIPQSFKWDPDVMRRNFFKHTSLTKTPAAQAPTFVIWPETALTEDISHNPGIQSYIRDSLPAGSVALIGALRADGENTYYNSVITLSKKNGLGETYNKHHLVPFGEYIPFRRYLNMTPVAAGIAMVGDFTPGPGAATLRINRLPKPSPLICYEAIFPGEVTRRAGDRPDWLLNVTNDAWYGKTAGPHQHLEITRVRAIEEGLPLVRAANTGISATIDPLGRIIGMKELNKEGVVDTILPRPLPPTPYARFGDSLFFLLLILLVVTGETLRYKP